jgi:hypothetical protein
MQNRRNRLSASAARGLNTSSVPEIRDQANADLKWSKSAHWLLN